MRYFNLHLIFFFLKKRNIGVAFIAFIFFGINQLNGQTKFSGKIMDGEKNQAVMGATVKAIGKDKRVYTNKLGWFEIYDKAKDSLRISIDHPKYSATKATIFSNYHLLVMLHKWEPSHIPSISFDKKKDLSTSIIFPKQNEISNPSDVALLLQHKIPGLTVTRPGNDPNEAFQVYNRGISSATQRNAPLVIIDGIPEVSLERLCPEDIASIAVTKSAYGGSAYGMLGGGGIIEINTIRFDTTMPILRYHSSLGIAEKQRGLEILDVDEYLRYKPDHDKGARMDWVDEVTQTAVSHRHHLSFAKGNNLMGMYASLGYQNENGILKRSGFEQGNVRLNFQKIGRDSQFIFSSSWAYLQRDSRLSQPETFWDASYFNPTKPAYNERGELIGGAFNTSTPLYNLMNRNDLVRSREWSGNAQIEKQLFFKQLFQAQLSYRQRKNIFANVSDIIQQSPFLLLEELDRKHISSSLQVKKKFHKKNITYKQHTGIAASLVFDKVGGFNADLGKNEKFNFKTIEKPSTHWEDGKNHIETKWHKHIISVFSGGAINWNIWTLDLSARYDYVIFKRKKGGNLFYNARIISDLTEFIKARWINKARLTVGFGKTGLPVKNEMVFIEKHRKTLAQEYLSPTFLDDDFLNEHKTEIDVMLDLSLFKDQFKASINLYENLLYDQVISPFSYFSGDIGNKGLEIFLSYHTKKEKNFKWNPTLGFFTNKSITFRLSETNEPDILSNIINSFSFFEIWFDPYGPAGQYYGFQTEPELSNGRYVAKDLDGDGTPDGIVIGNTKPSFGLTMTNEIKWKKWDVVANIRSIFGHNLFNNFRRINEVFSDLEWNFIKTKYFNENRSKVNSEVLDVFMENASFMKLDYISVGYTANLKKGNIRFYLAGHDLITITGYTGIDPEPRYQNAGVSLAGGYEPTESYYRSRRVVFGAQFSL